MSALIFISGCATDEQVGLDRAAAQVAEAGLIDRAIAVADKPAVKISPMPDRCGQREVSGVLQTDRLDIAVVKSDAALGRANTKIGECFKLANSKIAIANGRGRQ